MGIVVLEWENLLVFYSDLYFSITILLVVCLGLSFVVKTPKQPRDAKKAEVKKVETQEDKKKDVWYFICLHLWIDFFLLKVFRTFSIYFFLSWNSIYRKSDTHTFSSFFSLLNKEFSITSFNILYDWSIHLKFIVLKKKILKLPDLPWDPLRTLFWQTNKTQYLFPFINFLLSFRIDSLQTSEIPVLWSFR